MQRIISPPCWLPSCAVSFCTFAKEYATFWRCYLWKVLAWLSWKPSTKFSLILKLVNQVRRPKRPQNFPQPSNTTVACAGGRKSWMITRTNLQFRSVNRFTLELARSWKNQYWIINSLQKNEAIFYAFTLLKDFKTNVILNIKEERCFNGSSNEPQKSCYGRVYWRGFVILA